MALCTRTFSSLVDLCSPCGTSSDYPTHVKVVTLRDCSRDVLRHLESYGISGDEAIHSELKLLLARAGILFVFSIVLCSSIKLCNGLRGPQALRTLSYKYSLPLRPSSDVVVLPCRTKLQFSTTVARQEIVSDSDVVPDSIKFRVY